MTGQALLDEIYKQTRVEFWGEGKSYLAMKRNHATLTRGANHLFQAGVVITSYSIHYTKLYDHNKESASGDQSISGIGDITVLGFYSLVRTKNDSLKYQHHLQLGGGVKMPTGKFNETNNGSVNPSYQLGTGSWDYILATEYVIKRNRSGLNVMLNYNIKTENQKEYQFGNQFNYAGTFRITSYNVCYTKLLRLIAEQKLIFLN